MDEREKKQELQRLVGEMQAIVARQRDQTGVRATACMQRLIALWQREDTLDDEMLSNFAQGRALFEELQALKTLTSLDPIETGMTLETMDALESRARSLLRRTQRWSKKVTRWCAAQDQQALDNTVVTAEMVALKARMEEEARGG